MSSPDSVIDVNTEINDGCQTASSFFVEDIKLLAKKLFDGANGTDMDGYIKEWIWNFGNNVTEYGERINQIFYREGVYTITLTVVDNEGAMNTTSINLIIEKPNSKPSKPVIDGPINLDVNTNYTFIIASTDMDNDAIQFIIDWGDRVQTTTDFYPNATSVTLHNMWIEPGKYTIIVQAFDGESYSEISSMQITVSEVFQANYGYIVLLIIAIFLFIVLSMQTALNDRKKALIQS